MTTRQRILAEARKSAELRTADLVKKLGIARQSVAAHLKRLVEEGRLIREGATRSAVYRLAVRGEKSKKAALLLVKKLAGLEEHKVLEDVVRKLTLSRRLNKNALSIFSYAFTEMLNNAIDHSQSNSANIRVAIEKGSVRFEVRDFGVGIFKKVATEFKLEDEFEGLEHVLKGKQTTAPQAHSGEGIFFTSRIADLFVLRSHQLQASVDNRVKDTFLSQERDLKGTSVQFSVSANTRKSLSDLFHKHTNADFKFDRADQRIQIAAFGGSLSRSQAKRLLHGLDKFDRLTFDFHGVTEIGQGFADEVFRVYAQSNPQIKIDYTNAVPAVEFMIRRALESANPK